MIIRDEIGSGEDRRKRRRDWEGVVQVRSNRRCKGRHEREDMVGCGRRVSNRGQGKALWKH